MFKKGTFIIYGTAGVCQVIDIGRVSGVPVSHPEKDYYTLTKLRSGGTIYIPVDTTEFMRPVMTRDEANDLIARIPDIEERVCESRDQKSLNDYYRASLQSHSCEELIRLVKSVTRKNLLLGQRGKKPGRPTRSTKRKQNPFSRRSSPSRWKFPTPKFRSTSNRNWLTFLRHPCFQSGTPEDPGKCNEIPVPLTYRPDDSSFLRLHP